MRSALDQLARIPDQDVAALRTMWSGDLPEARPPGERPAVIITGMTTSGCVRATVNDAFMLNFHTVVPLECVADRSQLSHEAELIDMGAKSADAVDVGDLVAVLADPRPLTVTRA
ncbi:isochorismatase family protein [Blastococcus sp. CT_GayMR20]|uniref:isochorismatase family protein n=1 Tax=Blastococcus sp. CT_GayMR20 TaxID=2559609 RepID=UPI001ADDC0C1|nr:isochorismatase family protein [Blastococcus sp. CT_GayMR20]